MARFLNPLRLRNILEELNLTQADFARLAGISPGYLSQLLNDKPAGVQVRRAITEALNRLKQPNQSIFLRKGSFSDTDDVQENGDGTSPFAPGERSIPGEGGDTLSPEIAVPGAV